MSMSVGIYFPLPKSAENQKKSIRKHLNLMKSDWQNICIWLFVWTNIINTKHRFVLRSIFCLCVCVMIPLRLFQPGHSKLYICWHRINCPHKIIVCIYCAYIKYLVSRVKFICWAFPSSGLDTFDQNNIIISQWLLSYAFSATILFCLQLRSHIYKQQQTIDIQPHNFRIFYAHQQQQKHDSDFSL